ncbi:MAG: heparinase II/III family protein, partial [Candidatus Latescibacteria bacterium]|nr:heparinase II/III family protein [Candidatus Latescibacterota bacterium]
MSKFGPLWKGFRKEDTGGSTSLELGPSAVDATSELGSRHLSGVPMSTEAVCEFYGGFYPTVSWVDSLEPISRSERTNPQMIPPVDALTDADRQALFDQAAPYMAVAPDDLIGMVPLRNRIAGNARVMPSTRIAQCPAGDGETLTWRPDEPDTIWCPRGHTVDPFGLYPQTGSIEITGPRGDPQSYPYHDEEDGKRIYLNGEFMDSLRVYYLMEATRALGLLYQLTGDADYARRAASILFDFAIAVPYWPKTHRGRPGIAEEDRLRPVGEFPVYAGIWYDKYHTGLRHACGLAEAYDLVVNAPVWEALDARADGGGSRELIESDLFLYTIRDAIRYDIAYPHPDSALSNYIPYQATGLILFGRGAGMPELVHYAYWKLRQLAEKTLMSDSVFPESMSYGAMHIHGIARAAERGRGYSDPPGFVSSIDGRRFDSLDNEQELPQLKRAVETLASMVYPDGNYIQAHDTHHSMRQRRGSAVEETRPAGTPDQPLAPVLYPAFGHAALARGDRASGNQIQAHMHFSGNWGHDHDDMLNFILWAYGEELVSDVGYQLTYNGFSKAASGHNLVVVDRSTQGRISRPGELVGWHPCQDGVQVVEASAPDVYTQCHTYDRTLFLVPVGDSD